MYLSVTLQVYRVQYSQLSIKQNKRYNTIYKLIKQTYSINTHLPKDNIAAILTKYTWYFVLNTKPLFYSFFVLSGHNMLSRIQFRRRSMFKCILSKYWTQGLSIDIFLDGYSRSFVSSHFVWSTRSPDMALILGRKKDWTYQNTKSTDLLLVNDGI